MVEERRREKKETNSSGKQVVWGVGGLWLEADGVIWGDRG
jgi:hypothetical protein